MVRVYSQPGHGGSLGGIFDGGHQNRRTVDYDDILQQKRREERSYRDGGGGMRASASEGQLHQGGLQQQLDSLSSALSRLQGALNDSGPSNDPPTSPRKTWSAPNKDPFGGELQDPFKRSHSTGRTSQSGYEPSFGIGGSQARGRRGRGNAQGFDQARYMSELSQQMEEQKARKAAEEEAQGRDWWEGKSSSVPEYHGPHPGQEPPHLPGHQAKMENRRRMERQPGSQRPDPAEERRRYEDELREQMESKRRLDEEQKRKEREEEERLDRRTKEQQERLKREFDEETNKQKAKQEAKLRRQEELMRRQAELQKEMAAQKREAAERRLAEKRGGGSGARGRSPPREESPPPPGINFRSNSPPIPTIRNRSPEKRVESEEVGGGEEVVEQLSNMRHGLERRREQLEQENGVWDGLAEI